jgi:hypothetical protein
MPFTPERAADRAHNESATPRTKARARSAPNQGPKYARPFIAAACQPGARLTGPLEIESR